MNLIKPHLAVIRMALLLEQWYNLHITIIEDHPQNHHQLKVITMILQTKLFPIESLTTSLTLHPKTCHK